MERSPTLAFNKTEDGRHQKKSHPRPAADTPAPLKQSKDAVRQSRLTASDPNVARKSRMIKKTGIFSTRPLRPGCCCPRFSAERCLAESCCAQPAQRQPVPGTAPTASASGCFSPVPASGSKHQGLSAGLEAVPGHYSVKGRPSRTGTLLPHSTMSPGSSGTRPHVPHTPRILHLWFLNWDRLPSLGSWGVGEPRAQNQDEWGSTDLPGTPLSPPVTHGCHDPAGEGSPSATGQTSDCHSSCPTALDTSASA